MTAQSSSIQAKHLIVKKGKQQVLDGLTFTVKPGTITGLIGPSGSGKTTLMRAIVGVQKTTGGTLEVLEENAGYKHLRKKIGYVTQSPAIYDDLTVVQNLRYFAKLVHASKKGVDTIIKTIQLDPQRNQLAGTLSGGQRARVSLGIALLGNPELLVLDEPTVGLDPVLREDLWSLFAKLAKNGKTLLISSHVMDEAERCENLLLLRDGKLLWHESLDELLAKTNTKSVGDAFIKVIRAEEAK